MGRKKKEVSHLPTMAPQKFSFDTDTIVYLAALQYSVREAIQQRMLETADNPICMPVSLARKVVKEFGLQKYEILEDKK
ncbi:MAG: hypothetical protein M0R80_00700 [Proteobacteria bacterium]|nr:hypothetical protein [Pseudomonadota bacterium]